MVASILAALAIALRHPAARQMAQRAKHQCDVSLLEVLQLSPKLSQRLLAVFASLCHCTSDVSLCKELDIDPHQRHEHKDDKHHKL